MSNKPGWVRDAVATTVGWVNPKTNEVLAITTGLPDALEFRNNKIVWPSLDKVLKDEAVSEIVVEEDTAEPAVEFTVDAVESTSIEYEVVFEEDVTDPVPPVTLAVPEASDAEVVVDLNPPARKPGRPKKTV